MKIYWGWKDVPELTALSWRERRRVIRACYWKFGFRYWQCQVAFLVNCLFIALGVIAGVNLEYKYGFSSTIHLVCNMVGLSIGCLIFHNVMVRHLRPHFRDYIAKEQ